MSVRHPVKNIRESVKAYVTDDFDLTSAEQLAADLAIADGYYLPFQTWLREKSIEVHSSGRVSRETWNEWQSVKDSYVAAHNIKTAAEHAKFADIEKLWAARAPIEAELLQGDASGYDGIFQTWLRREKKIDARSGNGFDHDKITGEIWDEWQSVKADYPARLRAEGAARATKEQAAQAAQRIKQDAERDAATADLARRKKLLAKVQRFVWSDVALEPLDYKQIHELKKHPAKSKRDLVRRWLEKFRALPGDAQETVISLFESSTYSGDTVAVAEGEDGETQFHATSTEYSIHLIPRAPGNRKVDTDNVDSVVRGLRSEAFKAFRPFSEGVRRTLDVIGNPIDDVIRPAHNPNAPQPGQDVDDIEPPRGSGYIVPGLIRNHGPTVIHGDEGDCKSIFAIRLCLPIADKNGATFEGREIEHGPVIYSTLDPMAEREFVLLNVKAIRNRLGLQASGRFILTDSPLILNEPASVAAWLELNKARLPAKVIVVDSLRSASVGPLGQDTVMSDIVTGVKTMLRHCDAVILVHHDTKEGDIFGSVFLTPMLAGRIAIERKRKPPATDVDVTVHRVKSAKVTLKPVRYKLEGPFLVGAGAGADTTEGWPEDGDAGDVAALADAGPIKDLAMWNVIRPTLPRPARGSRALVEHLFPADSSGREKSWERTRAAWEAAGLIEQRGGMMTRGRAFR